MRKIRRILFTVICLCALAGGVSGLVPRANAASSMKGSDACVEFIKKAEGFSAKPYYDYSQHTVGYGTRCPADKYSEYMSNGISREAAEALLQEELADVEDAINKKFIDRNSLTLNQHQFDALVSFSYNIGIGWMSSNSTLKNAILSNANENDMVYAFGLYCTAGGKYSPGLITRRLCEANMYLNGVYSQTRSNDYGYVYYDAAGGSVTYRVQGYVCRNQSAPASDATKSADTFLGWYTELYGGTRVTELTREMTGKTLFARWQSSGDSQEETAAATTVRVTGDIVNIRTGPGTTYATVKQVRQNTTLTVSHVTHLTSMKWGKVSGGWICLDYTNYDEVINGTDNSEPENSIPSESVPDNDSAHNNQDAGSDSSTESQPPVSGVVKVTGYLNIRTGPGTNYPSVGFLFNNTKVTVTEQKALGTSVWGRMAKGWISMDYVVTDSPSGEDTIVSPPEQDTPPQQDTTDSAPNTAAGISGKITADALRVRSGPGTTNSIVGFYYYNDRVIVTEKVLSGASYWGKTGKGWISMDYFLEDSTNETPAPSPENKGGIITADCLRIRKEPGTNHKITGFLYQGDTVNITETVDVDGTLWGKVDKGWICIDYVN